MEEKLSLSLTTAVDRSDTSSDVKSGPSIVILPFTEDERPQFF